MIKNYARDIGMAGKGEVGVKGVLRMLARRGVDRGLISYLLSLT